MEGGHSALNAANSCLARRYFRSQGPLAQRRTHSRASHRRPQPASAADRPRSWLQRHAGKDAAHHAADSRAHQTAARRAYRSRFFLRGSAAALRSGRTDPAKGRCRHGEKVLQRAKEVLANVEFKHDPLDQTLRAAAQEFGIKAGQMFQPIRVAVCGRKNAPPLFETLEVLGRETTLKRITLATQKLQ